ncbi:hypothetical protein [Streptomyces sp. MJP52]|uniref:hypothetical protein n=1 Tax=Streptomyces sp. MJP52 TaxID=2940555 RepID=UPI0024737AFF|nr:hypothetical protein [Streptomyces sp. MJP52]MDH6223799.1 hypothetical protein [Streptomyces sp. MJP52]
MMIQTPYAPADEATGRWTGRLPEPGRAIRAEPETAFAEHAASAGAAGLLETYERHLAGVGRAAEPLPPGSVTASTDRGDVSRVVPSIHPRIGVLGRGATPHNAEFADGMTAPAGTALLDAAAPPARTGIDPAADAGRRRHHVALHERRGRAGR